MRQLATVLARSKAEIVEDVMARAKYDATERARLERWARQALAMVVLAAVRAGSSGTRGRMVQDAHDREGPPCRPAR